MGEFALTIHLGPEADDDLVLDDSGVLAFRVYERLSGMEPTLDLPKSQLHGFAPDDVSPDSPFEGGRVHHAPPIMGHDPAVSPPYYLRVLIAPAKLPGGRKLPDIVNAPAVLTLTDPAASATRHLRGLVQRVLRRDGPFTKSAAIELQIYPWLWALALSEKCRVWKEVNSIDVLEQLVGEYAGELGDRPVIEDSALTAPPPRRESVIQWHESDFEFVSRLLERDGIFYTFRHDDRTTTVQLRDTRSGFPEGEAAARRSLELDSRVGPGSELFDDTVTHLTTQVQSTPRRYRVGDYNPMQAPTPLDYGAPAEAASAMEVYDYPGEFDSLGDAPDIARRRYTALEARRQVTYGAGRCPFLAAGSTHALPDPLDDEAEPVEVHVTQAVHELVRGDGGLPVFRNWFEAMDADQGYAPSQRTPVPTVHGTHNAEVVSSLPGETVDVDEHSRALVIFRWDREFKRVRVRLGQPWAGAKHGMHVLPRAGDEVLIGFIQGSTEQPVLLTSVHNSRTPKMLGARNQSTRGLQNAVDPGPERPNWYATALHNSTGNAIYFNDTDDKEFVKIDAFKDLDIEVGHKAEGRSVNVSDPDRIQSAPSNDPSDIGGREDKDEEDSNKTFQKDPDKRGNFNIRTYGNMEIYVGKLTDSFEEQKAKDYDDESGGELDTDNRGNLDIYIMGDSSKTVEGGSSLTFKKNPTLGNMISASYERNLGLLPMTSSVSTSLSDTYSFGMSLDYKGSLGISMGLSLSASYGLSSTFSYSRGLSVSVGGSLLSIGWDNGSFSYATRSGPLAETSSAHEIVAGKISLSCSVPAATTEKMSRKAKQTGLETAIIVLMGVITVFAIAIGFGSQNKKAAKFLLDWFSFALSIANAVITTALYIATCVVSNVTRKAIKASEAASVAYAPKIELDTTGVTISCGLQNWIQVSQAGIEVSGVSYTLYFPSQDHLPPVRPLAPATDLPALEAPPGPIIEEVD